MLRSIKCQSSARRRGTARVGRYVPSDILVSTGTSRMKTLLAISEMARLFLNSETVLDAVSVVMPSSAPTSSRPKRWQCSVCGGASMARDNYGGRSATIRMTGMRHRRVAPIPLSQASIAQQ